MTRRPSGCSAAAALIVTATEEFGIVAVEAQASGRPVIGPRAGGVLETVIDGRTGVFYDEPTPESLIAAVQAFDPLSVDPTPAWPTPGGSADAFSERFRRSSSRSPRPISTARSTTDGPFGARGPAPAAWRCRSAATAEPPVPPATRRPGVNVRRSGDASRTGIGVATWREPLGFAHGRGQCTRASRRDTGPSAGARDPRATHGGGVQHRHPRLRPPARSGCRRRHPGDVAAQPRTVRRVRRRRPHSHARGARAVLPLGPSARQRGHAAGGPPRRLPDGRPPAARSAPPRSPTSRRRSSRWPSGR